MDELRKSFPPESNKWTFRYIVGGVRLVALVPPVVLAAVSPFVAHESTQLASSIIQISSTALGALAAYLTGRRLGSPTS